jgi:hypothetical protein
MVMVEIDSNAILVEPISSRDDHELARAYQVLMTRLLHAGIVRKKHILDNKVSEAMKTVIKNEYKMAMELVPPGCHHRDAAEVAIQNFKAHFLSVLAGAAEDFPPSLWDRLLLQTEISLNLLRQSNATPTVSSYAHLCKPFDYNKMPLAPMGCAVQVHEKTDKRGTWAYHFVDGWYLSTSHEHYCTHRCHIKATKSERVSDTVNFSHKHITRPTITHADKIMNAIADCAKAIKDITSPNGAEEMRQLGGTFRTGHPPAPCHRQIVRDTRQHHPISSEGAHDNPNDHPFSSEGAKNRNSPTTDTVDSTVTRTRQTTNQTSIFGTNKKTYKRTSNAKH